MAQDQGCQIMIPDSQIRFPDGAHFRNEVSGIETADILRAVIDEARRSGIPIHRAIATVAGSKFYSDAQMRELARVAADHGVEVIICAGSLARAVLEDPNRIFSNLNFRNSRELGEYLDEVKRCIDLGFRGFLAWRKSVLAKLDELRIYESIPEDVIFKVSTFDNNMIDLDFALAEMLGADTINVANGVPLEDLAEIRKMFAVTMDCHITFWQLYFEKNAAGRLELGARSYDRIEDAPEIARICAPVYFKFEAGTPGIGVYDVPRPDWTFEDLAEHKRKDVRVAADIVRRIERDYPGLIISGWAPLDLRVPVI